MKVVFTDFIRRLAKGEKPEREDFDEVRRNLGKLLAGEMHKRGLWSSPPAYLGVVAASWQEKGALDELVADAFHFVLIQRLVALGQQLLVNPTIEGLIVRNVRNFLTERQRESDPLGYRVFTRLKMAVEQLLASGQLSFSGPDPGRAEEGKSRPARLANSSLLTSTRQLAPVAATRLLERIASSWNDSLMPDVVLAEGRAVNELVERIVDLIGNLPGEGVIVFRFGDLVTALKDDARNRWSAVGEGERESAPEDGEPGAAVVPIVRPDATAFDFPNFCVVVFACVESGIDAVTKPKRARELWRLWVWLRNRRLETDLPPGRPGFSEIGRQVGLQRERVKELYEQLKQLVISCLESAGAPIRIGRDRDGI